MGIYDRDAPGARLEPQFQLSGVLGDYWFRRSERLPSAALVDLAADFGVTEASARQAMRRLVLRGTLVSERVGRATAYGFPERSAAAIAERLSTLINSGREFPPWDEKWTIVTFSVPEASRDTRRSLRTRLRALGFGCLQDAVWASPHELTAEATELLDGFGIADAHVFRGTHQPRAGDEVSLSEVFDTKDLAAQYSGFVEEYASVPTGLAPKEAMVTRTMMMFDWRTIHRKDPDLPQELLPADWPRPRAYALFRSLYDALGPAGEERFKQIVAAHDPNLAALAGRHS